jgi:CRP/FNR family transcriptional regulator, dissimilatory nitrate respiration regulator
MLCITDNNVRSALVKHGVKVSMPKGAFLFEQGKTADGMYLIVSGSVQTNIGGGVNHVPRVAESGSLLGVPATINGVAYSISARVKEDAELVRVSRPQLLELMRSNPAVALSIIDLLSREVREMRLEIKKPTNRKH